MTMNYYAVFYWLTVADAVKKFFDASSNIFTTICVAAFAAVVVSAIGKSISISNNNVKTIEEEKTHPEVRSWGIFRMFSLRIFYIMLSLSLLTWAGYVFVPSKRDCYIIVAGGAVGNFISSDSSAKKIPTEALQLLRDKIREESASINIKGGADTLAHKSKEELIKLIQEKK
jgi:hypothetical protein